MKAADISDDAFLDAVRTAAGIWGSTSAIDHEAVDPPQDGASWRCVNCEQLCASDNPCDCCDEDREAWLSEGLA